MCHVKKSKIRSLGRVRELDHRTNPFHLWPNVSLKAGPAMLLRTYGSISIHLNNSQPTISLLIFLNYATRIAWEMPRAAIIHPPRHNRGARIIGGDEKEGRTHKKVSFIFSFSPNPKDNIPDPGVQAPILKYHMQRKERKCGK